MKQFTHKVTDLVGIHARPASAIVADAKKFDCDITLRVGDKEVDLKNLSEFLETSIKHADKVTVTLDGEDEDVACAAMKVSFEKHL